MKKLLVLSALLAASISTQAATMTFLPTADGDVTTVLRGTVRTTNTFNDAFQSGPRNITNAIFEYDLNALSATELASVSAATFEFTLTRFVSNTGRSPAAVDIFAYDGDGIVDIADYSAEGTQVVDTTTPWGGNPGETRAFTFTDVTPIVDSITGLLTLRLETDSFASIRSASLENQAYSAASLELTYTEDTNVSAVPVPAALPLMASALGMFGVARRKRA